MFIFPRISFASTVSDRLVGAPPSITGPNVHLSSVRRRAPGSVGSLRRCGISDRPPHIDEHEWGRWKQHWSSESFQKFSKRGFENRKVGVGVGEPAPPTHRAGSRSFHECAMMMAAQRGIPVQDVPYYEVFDATHRRDGSNFCNQRATQVAAEYKRMLEAAQADNANTPASVPEQNNIFQTAAGGVSKKRRLFGLGSIGKSIASSSGIPRPPPPPPPTRLEDTPEFQQAVSRVLRKELARLGIAPQQNPEDGSPPHSPE